jgi:transposase
MAILTVGIDLAKNVFAVHGINEAGKPELVRPAVAREKLHELIAALPPCVIGMEACSGAHHWARLFPACGHTVRLIAPKFVTPYRMTGKRGKNDAADGAAICEAVQRPHMRFVPIKNLQQQSQLMLHRARQGFVEQRTATFNRIRGLLSEFDIVPPLKAATVRRRACECLDSNHERHRRWTGGAAMLCPATAELEGRASNACALRQVSSSLPALP